MKSTVPFSPALAALFWLLLLPVTGRAQQTHAAALWIGPNTNFTQSASNLTDVLIPGAVSLTRAHSQWLFNPAAGDQGPGPGTPTDTEWAFGLLTNYNALGYQTFDALRNGDLSALLIGNPMVVHLTNENIYLSLTFSAWPQHGGYFAYTRSTPAAAAPLPTVAITNPVAGAVFAAPANVSISAAAAVASGSVTNVAFLANTTSLGAAKSAPFDIAAQNLAAGSYALTAVATAGGVSVTSTVVNITVVAPITIILSSQSITGGQFAFDYPANLGLGYVVQKSSNMVNWLSLITNVSTSYSAHFTDNFTPNGAGFYRVGRLPNP